MKCNEIDKSKHRHHMNIDKLDKALHDLGMLSTITEARREYLSEAKTNFGTMRYNSRYVSNVTMGYCMRRVASKNRLCPYLLPVRHRTKSENSDAMNCEVNEGSCELKGILEPTSSGIGALDFGKSPAKRCQSLENINLLVDPQPAPQVSPDMDCVSTRIEKLQVDE